MIFYYVVIMIIGICVARENKTEPKEPKYVRQIDLAKWSKK